MQRYQQTRYALGSTASLALVLASHTNPEAVFDGLWGQIDAFEQRFSRFRTSSELSRFNLKTGKTHPVSPDFRELLSTARTMAERSGGLYNPFILPALQRAGYKGSWPTPEEVQAELDYGKRDATDWRNIEIDEATAKIPNNTALDFGGIGKGYLLDQLHGSLQEQDIHDYWLSLGGDIMCCGHDITGTDWRIAIQHATDTDKLVASISNNGQPMAIATSGTTKRKGLSKNRPWHHLIDPRTGRPAATDVLTASVCTENATIADVGAKCLVVAGSSASKDVATTMNIRDYLVQTADGLDVKIVREGDVWSAQH